MTTKARATIPAVDLTEALARNPQLRLNDPAAKPLADSLRQRVRHEPGYGRQLLVQAGILNAAGKLTKPFGGA